MLMLVAIMAIGPPALAMAMQGGQAVPAGVLDSGLAGEPGGALVIGKDNGVVMDSDRHVVALYHSSRNDVAPQSGVPWNTVLEAKPANGQSVSEPYRDIIAARRSDGTNIRFLRPRFAGWRYLKI